MHLRGKEELIIELESNNDKLRMQIQATMGSLEKYQSDLGVVQKLKQEVINKEQQYMAAVREIEKYKESSKSLIKKIDKLEGQLDLLTREYVGQDSIEFQESRSRELHLRKLEYQLAEIYKETDNEDPISFIQDLKSIHASLGMSK
jgi:proline dehydrogenase